MRRYLDDMLYGRRTMTWPADDGDRLARRIREAINTAKRYEDFGIYHELGSWYTIHNRKTWVEAEWKGIITGTGNREGAHIVHIPEPKRVLIEVTTADQVVGACIKMGAETEEFHFPNVVMTPNELKAVHLWGKDHNGWKLIYHEDAGITMTRRQVDEIYLWHPDGEDDR